MNASVIRLILVFTSSAFACADLLGQAKPDAPETDEYSDVQTLTRLPKTDREISAVFAATDRQSCEQLPKGEPLEVRTMTAALTMRDRLLTKTQAKPSSRVSVFSVGLEIDASDRADLPMLSGGKITEYLNENCVLIQARMRKDLLTRKLYYYHRPLAVTAAYRGARMSLQFEDVVAANIRQFHGVGLFIEDKKKISAEQLRTLVLTFRNNVMKPGSLRADEQYEYVFVRGRESKIPDRLEHHVFVTAEDRQVLYYVSPYAQPTRPNRCSILGRIAITDYDPTGVYPKESATRSYKIDSRAKFLMADIDKYCADNQLEGGIHLNLTKVLDAIIDRKIRSSGLTLPQP